MMYDIFIVGAGPAGLSFARSLANFGLRIALIERQGEEHIARPEFDGRDIALTHLSVRILKELGIWARFDADDRPPIKEARVLDGASPYCLSFDGGRDSNDALRYIVSNHVIRKALFDEVETLDNIDIHSGVAVTSVATNDTRATIVLAAHRWSS